MHTWVSDKETELYCCQTNLDGKLGTVILTLQCKHAVTLMLMTDLLDIMYGSCGVTMGQNHYSSFLLK